VLLTRSTSLGADSQSAPLRPASHSPQFLGVFRSGARLQPFKFVAAVCDCRTLDCSAAAITPGIKLCRVEDSLLKRTDAEQADRGESASRPNVRRPGSSASQSWRCHETPLARQPPAAALRYRQVVCNQPEARSVRSPRYCLQRSRAPSPILF